MRQKELRIALVCYGGVSLAVYMHGVTKEIWKLAKASRAYHADVDVEPDGVERVYLNLLKNIEEKHQLKLRMLPDIITGASAGGINAVFLAQAIHSGRSLEPLTALWLDTADVETLVDPDARPWSVASRAYMRPIVWYLTRAPGNTVSETVSQESRSEVRRKISSLVRGRWFEPPFSGSGFTKLINNALVAMGDEQAGSPLLPPRHPLDLMVTATDFRGRLETLRLHSPAQVDEPEHRLPIGFRSAVPEEGGHDLADLCELTLAARATASFPGAFPPLRLAEIDAIAGDGWQTRDAFLRRIMPTHVKRGTTEHVALVDGSVLNNAPFEGAIAGLNVRPSQREVDRRFVYIDPSPRRPRPVEGDEVKRVSFFAAIAGSLSAIPREQPIRDNLEVLERQTREAETLRKMVSALRPEVESEVDRLFGRTFFLDKPNRKRLSVWRARAQQAAAEKAGYAFHSYAQAKLTGIIDRLADLARKGSHAADVPPAASIASCLRQEIEQRGMATLSADNNGGASSAAVMFFRDHDLAFRVRRLRLLARRLSRDWELDPNIADEGLEEARDSIYRALALYFAKEDVDALGDDFAEAATNVMDAPGAFLDLLAESRQLRETDQQAELVLSEGLEAMPKDLRRRVLLAYLGFPFYDVSTLPLLRNEGLTEYDPVKVDRISPEDASTIREGGTAATLRGTEFYNFGAFFSRSYRENDYLWGRMHGAERMIDLVCSTITEGHDLATCRAFKRDAFLAICDEEEARRTCNPQLVAKLRAEIVAKLGED